MYDDSWYSILPESQPRRDDAAASGTKRRRRESLLKQSNDDTQFVSSQGESLTDLLEEPSSMKGPPKATLIPRASSYSDFHHITRAELTKEAIGIKLKSDQELSVMNSEWDQPIVDDWHEAGYDDDLLDADQEEFILYRDQLRLTERHLDTLIKDTTSALDLLAGLSESFDTVEKETTAFQSQCQVLLDDQKRLKNLKDEVEDNLQYYSFLEPITRRLNAPGASRLVRDESFIEMLTNLNNCILFMSENPHHREAETYLARYSSLLLRALNLFESQYSKDLSNRVEDIRKRRAEGSLNDTTLYALLYRPMDSAMQKTLRQIAAWAVAIEPESFSSELSQLYASEVKFQRHRTETSPATSVYQTQIQMIIQRIASSRRDQLEPKIGEAIQALHTAVENKEDIMKECRICVKTFLDICKDELCHLYTQHFTKYHAQNVARIGYYTYYLDGFCNQVTEALCLIVARTDLQSAVKLSTWIEHCYVMDFSHYPIGEAVDTVGGQDDNAGEGGDKIGENDSKTRDNEETRLFESNRKQFTLKMSHEIKRNILSRFSELTLRSIEKYEPKPIDLQTAPPYRRGSLSGSKVPSSDTREVTHNDRDDIDILAIGLLGEIYLTAYPPVKSAIRMLILHNEMFPSTPEDDDAVTYTLPGSGIYNSLDAVEKSRFEIIHQTIMAVQKASSRISATIIPTIPTHVRQGRALLEVKIKPGKAYHHFLFATHNLYILNRLLVTYELPAVTKTSELDFSDVWTTLREMRDRGLLLDPRAYYTLIKAGKLMPKVLERVSDARVELDGTLRGQIVNFTQGWANRIVGEWKEEGRNSFQGQQDPSFDELKWVLEWSLVGDDQLIKALLAAVEDECFAGIHGNTERVSYDRDMGRRGS